MRLSRLALAALVLPVLLPAQSFPSNTDLAKPVTLLNTATQVQAIAVDSTGNIYLAGTVVGSLSGSSTGIGPRGDADLFVIKTNSTGDQIIYATVIGGTSTETLLGMRIDANGNAYLLGSTTSRDFPFSSTVQPLNPIGAFVAKLNAAGTALSYAREMGGRMSAIAFDVDSSGDVYVGGTVATADFATTPGVIKTTVPAGVGPDDQFGFIARLTTTGQAFDIATFYGNIGQSVSYLSVRSNGILVLSSGTLALLNTSLGTQTASVASGFSSSNIAFDSNNDIYMSGTLSAGGFGLRKFSGTGLQLSADMTNSLKSAAGLPVLTTTHANPRIAVSSNGRIFLFGEPVGPRFFQSKNATQPCLTSLAGPIGIAGQVGGSGDLIGGGGGTIPPQQALLILDSGGNILHATHTNSNVSQLAVGPSNGSVYAAVTQTLFTTPDWTYWRGIVRYNQASLPAVQAAPSCVVNSTTFVATPLSPGGFMTILGTHLGPVNFAYFTVGQDGLLPKTLGGVSVTVDGKSAAMIYAQDVQVNFIVPWSTRTDGTVVPVCLTFESVTACTQISAAPAAPGALICTYLPDGPCAANFSDTVARGTTVLNSAASPIAAGDVLIVYGSGFGTLQGAALADGSVLPPPTSLRNTTATVTASLDAPAGGGCGLFGCDVAASQRTADTFPVNVDFAGGAPNFVAGAVQLNLHIPTGVPSGHHVITVAVLSPGTSNPVTTPIDVYIK